MTRVKKGPWPVTFRGPKLGPLEPPGWPTSILTLSAYDLSA